MRDCTAMRDRMPDVARGTETWADAEVLHLAASTECAREWRVVHAGVGLQGRLVIGVDRVADVVLARLRTEPLAAPVIRRLPWRGTVIGLLAAAASVVLILNSSRLQRSPSVDRTDALTITVLPELAGLDESELVIVLQSLGPTAGDATPGVVPHLEDLTDTELEQLLHSTGVV